MKSSYLSLIISIIAVLIAGFSAFSCIFDINSVSFPLGVLSLLVALLIGWQIHNYIFQRQEVQGILEKEMNNLREELSFHKDNVVFIALGQLGLALYNAKDFSGAVLAYFNALAAWNDKMAGDKTSQEGYDKIISDLVIIEKKIKDGEMNASSLCRTTGERFLNTATKIGKKEIIDLAIRFR